MPTPTPGKWSRKEDLRALWKRDKAASEAKAKALKETDKLKKLQKDKMNDNLGDSLEAWVKAYPSLPKLEEGKKKLDKIVDKYLSAVKECTTISEDVKKPMRSTLTLMKRALEIQLDDAKLSILGASTEAVKKLGTPQMIGLGPGNKIGSQKK